MSQITSSETRSETGTDAAEATTSRFGWLPGWLSPSTVFWGSTIGIVLNLYAFMVPLFTLFGGGVVAGLFSGYVLEFRRAVANGLVVGAICGITGGLVVAGGGSMLGLFIEPPTLGSHVVGIVTPVFGGETTLEKIAIVGSVSGLVLVDVLVGVVVGAGLRLLR